MMEKTVVIGDGWLGNRIGKFLKCKVSKYKLFSPQEIHEFIDYDRPTVIINAAGRTGVPNIDWCEKNKEETMFSNLTLPLMIAQVCSKRGVRMVHLGTGCIYQGKHYFKESERPNFNLSYYSKTKYLAEQALSDFPVLQLRIRMPIDSVPSPRNLMTKLLSYENLISCDNSITVVPDFLVVLKKLMSKKATGIFNVVNPGDITHDDIVNIYNQYAKKQKRYNAISIIDLARIVCSPRSNCTLSTENLASVGIKVPNIKLSLNKVLKEYCKNEITKRNPR